MATDTQRRPSSISRLIAPPPLDLPAFSHQPLPQQCSPRFRGLAPSPSARDTNTPSRAASNRHATPRSPLASCRSASLNNGETSSAASPSSPRLASTPDSAVSGRCRARQGLASPSGGQGGARTGHLSAHGDSPSSRYRTMVESKSFPAASSPQLPAPGARLPSSQSCGAAVSQRPASPHARSPFSSPRTASPRPPSPFSSPRHASPLSSPSNANHSGARRLPSDQQSTRLGPSPAEAAYVDWPSTDVSPSGFSPAAAGPPSPSTAGAAVAGLRSRSRLGPGYNHATADDATGSPRCASPHHAPAASPGAVTALAPSANRTALGGPAASTQECDNPPDPARPQPKATWGSPHDAHRPVSPKNQPVRRFALPPKLLCGSFSPSSPSSLSPATPSPVHPFSPASPSARKHSGAFPHSASAPFSCPPSASPASPASPTPSASPPSASCFSSSSTASHSRFASLSPASPLGVLKSPTPHSPASRSASPQPKSPLGRTTVAAGTYTSPCAASAAGDSASCKGEGTFRQQQQQQAQRRGAISGAQGRAFSIADLLRLHSRSLSARAAPDAPISATSPARGDSDETGSWRPDARLRGGEGMSGQAQQRQESPQQRPRQRVGGDGQRRRAIVRCVSEQVERRSAYSGDGMTGQEGRGGEGEARRASAHGWASADLALRLQRAVVTAARGRSAAAPAASAATVAAATCANSAAASGNAAARHGAVAGNRVTSSGQVEESAERREEGRWEVAHGHGERHGEWHGEMQGERHGERHEERQGERHGERHEERQGERHGERQGEWQGERHGERQGCSGSSSNSGSMPQCPGAFLGSSSSFNARPRFPVNASTSAAAAALAAGGSCRRSSSRLALSDLYSSSRDSRPAGHGTGAHTGATSTSGGGDASGRVSSKGGSSMGWGSRSGREVWKGARDTHGTQSSLFQGGGSGRLLGLTLSPLRARAGADGKSGRQGDGRGVSGPLSPAVVPRSPSSVGLLPFPTAAAPPSLHSPVLVPGAALPGSPLPYQRGRLGREAWQQQQQQQQQQQLGQQHSEQSEVHHEHHHQQHVTTSLHQHTQVSCVGFSVSTVKSTSTHATVTQQSCSIATSEAAAAAQVHQSPASARPGAPPAAMAPLVAKSGGEAWAAAAKGAPDGSQGSEEQARQQRLWRQSERAAERRRKARASDFVLRKPYADIREEYVVARKEIGSGQFGIIRKCVQRQSGLTFACKTIAKAGILTAEDAEDVRNEVGFLEELRGHPHIVAVHATYEDDDNIHIVMELCKGGDLFDRIKLRGRMPEPAAAAICKALVGVLLHCHARGVLHMDVKPENVLMCDRCDDTHIKLIDFGVATRFTAGVPCREVLGTPEYIAPEVLKGAYGPPADLWSAGVVLYVMLAAAPPFWERASKTLKESILGDDVPFTQSKWGDRSAECKELIRRMLDKDPATRITGKEILEHPWIKMRTDAS
ncbi:unnamed protein product [Closterium sp. NIES-54]